MNDNTKEEEQTYVKGFNNGFKLAKFQPELFARIKDSLNPDKEYDRGLIEGSQQWEREKEKQRIEELHQMRESNEQEQEQER
jgi:hypothetical protein